MLEANRAAAAGFDHYVRTGKGDPAALIHSRSFFATWKDDEFAGLILWLQKSGSRLGGMTAPYMLRHMGKDSYIPSRDVEARLVAEGVVDKAPSSPKSWAAVQGAFNTWRAESGLPITTISRVLAQSVG